MSEFCTIIGKLEEDGRFSIGIGNALAAIPSCSLNNGLRSDMLAENFSFMQLWVLGNLKVLAVFATEITAHCCN